MLKISESDFTPLEQFALKWRWTDSKWNELPAADLAQIQPLSTTKAKEISARTVGWFKQDSLNPEVFYERASFDERINTSNEPARLWLQGLPVEPEKQVVVAWDNQLAVLTTWEVFCSYWDDFCYPGFDVLVFPLCEKWALFYHHEELLFFGVRLDAASN